MCGPHIRLRCREPMKIMKVIDTGLQIKKKTLQCHAWGGHIIQSQQMFVAVCKSERHISGRPHVVCDICIENHDVFATFMDPNYSICKDYYQYKQKNTK